MLALTLISERDPCWILMILFVIMKLEIMLRLLYRLLDYREYYPFELVPVHRPLLVKIIPLCMFISVIEICLLLPYPHWYHLSILSRGGQKAFPFKFFGNWEGISTSMRCGEYIKWPIMYQLKGLISFVWILNCGFDLWCRPYDPHRSQKWHWKFSTTHVVMIMIFLWQGIC